MHSVVPVFNFFFGLVREVSAAGGALLSSTVSMPALQQCALSAHVACMSSPNDLVVVVFSPTKPRITLNPDNAIKSSESRKNLIAEYQARKTALESRNQS